MSDRTHAASRLVALDGLRGVAAVVVVLWHFATMIGRRPPTAMMAVDLFFLISGFVIPYAYESKLRAGLSFTAFVKIRMVRLYPLYILGSRSASCLICRRPSPRARGRCGDRSTG